MPVKALVATVIGVVLVGAIAFTVIYVRREAAKANGDANGQGRVAEEGVDEETEAMLEVQGLAPEHYEGGRPAWKIKLARLAVEKGGRTITAGDLKEGLIYDKQGNPAVRVTAKTVEYDAVTSDFDLSGNVRIVSPKGAVISTQKVHWDSKLRTLTTPGQIMLRTKNEITVVTAGLKFDTPTQIIYCPNQVRMDTGRSDLIGRNLKYPLEKGPVTMESAQGVIDIGEAQERTGTG